MKNLARREFDALSVVSAGAGYSEKTCASDREWPGSTTDTSLNEIPFIDQYYNGMQAIANGIRDTQIDVIAEAMENAYSPERAGIIEIDGFDQKICPLTGVTGNLVYWLLTAQWADHMARRGEMPWILVFIGMTIYCNRIIHLRHQVISIHLGFRHYAFSFQGTYHRKRYMKNYGRMMSHRYP